MNYIKNILVLLLLSNRVLFAQSNCEKYESLKIAFKEDHVESVCELNLRNQSLKELPMNIGDLVNLEVIHLENNKLSSLPESIVNAKKLVRIYLDENEFRFFPESILKIEHLEKLSMNNNHNVLDLLEQNQDKINWNNLSKIQMIEQ